MRVAVLGGGPGGYSAAFEAARLGAEVTLIERDRLGGTCLNRGCIPTKTILRSAHIAHDAKHADEYGIGLPAATVDVDRLRERKEGVVDTLVGQLDATAKRLKVTVLNGAGRMVAPHEIEVDLAAGGSHNVEADAVILATGSLVFRLPHIDHDLPGVWTSDDAVALTQIPGEIVIIGGGVIGLEFACAYASFGSTVTVVELVDQVLPGNDKRVAKSMQSALEQMGVVFHIGNSADSVEQAGARVRTTLKDGTAIESDIVMSAVGRRPNSEGFGFSEIGLEFDRAALKVDEHMRTNLAGVYAIGDLIGGMMLAHVAEEEGVIAARTAVADLGGEAHLETIDYSCVPAAVYTFPEVGVVGSSRDSAKERGLDAVQAVSKFAANGKALGEGDSDGFVQLVAEKGSGQILGCQIVGPHAVEIIQEVAVAKRWGLTVEQLAQTVHGHPTVGEVIKAAAIDAASKI